MAIYVSGLIAFFTTDEGGNAGQSNVPRASKPESPVVERLGQPSGVHPQTQPSDQRNSMLALTNGNMALDLAQGAVEDGYDEYDEWKDF